MQFGSGPWHFLCQGLFFAAQPQKQWKLLCSTIFIIFFYPLSISILEEEEDEEEDDEEEDDEEEDDEEDDDEEEDEEEDDEEDEEDEDSG